MKNPDIKKLDELWAKTVKDKARWVCEFCGITGVRMEAAHVVGRSHRTTRWGILLADGYDLAGHCLCHNCHKQYDEHGPLEFMIVEKTIGTCRKVMLQKIANGSVAKYQDFEIIKEQLSH